MNLTVSTPTPPASMPAVAPAGPALKWMWAAIGVLGVSVLALGATLWWSQRALERPYQMMERYLGLSKTFQNQAARNIDDYLASGDALRHSAATQAIGQFAGDLDSLPREFRYGVEVRHPEFFAKGEAEQQLNRGLHQRNVEGVQPFNTRE